MTSRERLLAALAHRAPDRVPMDLGGTMASTLTLPAYERLRAYLGLPPDPAPALFARRSQTVIPAEDLLEGFPADVRPLMLGAPALRPERWLGPDAFLDEWGVTWRRPGTGHYLPAQGPFQTLEAPGAEDLGRFPWPDPEDPGRYEGLAERARRLRQAGHYAIALSLGVGPVHLAQFMRGYAEFLEDLLERPAFAEGLLDGITEFWVRVLSRALAEAGEWVDLVVLYDDLGTQRGPLLRPELYQRLIRPRHARLAAPVKQAGKPLLWHSCGSIRKLIPDLLEIGVDAVNPVQVSAAGMDTRELKREFGSRLAFWGGVDTRRILPFGTPQEVRREVRRRLEDLSEGGGYVLCAVHNLQADVPPENIAAMYEAALEWGR